MPGSDHFCLFMTAMTAAASAVSAAGLAVRAANTLGAVLFCTIDIEGGAAHDTQDNHCDEKIHHTQFPPLTAHSVFSLLSALIHRNVTMPAIATTAIRPPVKPAPNPPVVISVPIW